MLQRLKRFHRLLGLFLSRPQGMAWLERVQASSVSDTDRALVTRLMRATLKLPEAPGDESSAPAAPFPARPTPQGKAKRQRHEGVAPWRRTRNAS